MRKQKGSNKETKKQEKIKTKEREVLTIGFSAAGVSQHVFSTTLETETDATTINNRFVQSVIFAR